MAEATPLSIRLDAFGDARGDDLDGAWAYGVAWRLMRRDVEPEQVCEGLDEALDVVRQTQEAPADVFGAAGDHADELYDRWVQEGRLRLWDAGRMTWPEVPSSGLAWSAFLTLAFMVAFLLDGRSTLEWTTGTLLIPVALGLLKAAGAATWDSLLRRWSHLVAVGGTVVVLAAMAFAIAGVNEWGKGHPFGTASTWWYVPVAATCALLSTTWRRWLDAKPPEAPEGIADVDDWSRQLAGILRGRYSLNDAYVRRIIGDAHAHAADAGSTVQEEFGTPEEYAAGFAPDLRRRDRLEALGWAVSGTYWVVWILLAEPTWWRVGGAVLSGWLAWRAATRRRD